MLDELANSGVSILVEDFKTRLQELLTLSGEISTWTLTYCTALVLTIAWILARKRDEVDNLFESQKGITPLLILFVALVNALYILGIVVKSYNIHLNALYLNEVLSPRIRQMTGEPAFYTWDQWRRANISRTGNIVYYGYYLLIVLVPLFVSGFILGRYWHHERPLKDRQWRKVGICFFIS
jgi:hypothetical protein